jgi:predicted phosphodiesterase
MKYAILSDIHANLEALQAVLEDARPRAETFVCLGDIVGYNADPVACLHLIQELCEVVVIGNHDQAAVGLRSYDDFNPYAQAAIDWTMTQLTPDDMAFLQALPVNAPFGERYLAAHGSPRHTDEYLLHHARIKQNFVHLMQWMPQIHCCFVGHTHIPMVWQCTGKGLVSRIGDFESDTIALDPEQYYIVNPGSVGQPRHGDPASSYVVLDDVANTLTYRAVPYDIVAAQDKIYDAMLPIPLAERLEVGR